MTKMKYLLLIPSPFFGVLVGWLMFAAMPGMAIRIFVNFAAERAYTNAAGPYAAAFGAVALTVFAFLAIREEQ